MEIIYTGFDSRPWRCEIIYFSSEGVLFVSVSSFEGSPALLVLPSGTVNIEGR
jgi:hypothetical protein